MQRFFGSLIAMAVGILLVLAYQHFVRVPQSPAKVGAAFYETQADSFREYNPQAAAGAYQSALALNDPTKDAKARGALFAKYGYVLYELGENERAKEAFTQAKLLGHEDAWSAFTENAIARVDMAGPYPRFLEEPQSAPPPAALLPPKVQRAEPALPPAVVQEEEEEEEEVSPEPAPSTPRDDCTLQLPRRWERGTYLVGATVDDVDTTLILDTGATFTVLSRSLVEEAGIEVNAGPGITARTAAGIRRFDTGYAESFWVGGREIKNLRVTICEDCAAEQSAGLLGLDVQRALGMSLDVVNDVIRFADCE